MGRCRRRGAEDDGRPHQGVGGEPVEKGLEGAAVGGPVDRSGQHQNAGARGQGDGVVHRRVGPTAQKAFGREFDQIEETAASLDVQSGPGQSPGLGRRGVAGADGNQWGGGDQWGHVAQPNHTVLTRRAGPDRAARPPPLSQPPVPPATPAPGAKMDHGHDAGLRLRRRSDGHRSDRRSGPFLRRPRRRTGQCLRPPRHRRSRPHGGGFRLGARRGRGDRTAPSPGRPLSPSSRGQPDTVPTTYFPCWSARR